MTSENEVFADKMILIANDILEIFEAHDIRDPSTMITVLLGSLVNILHVMARMDGYDVDELLECVVQAMKAGHRTWITPQ